MEPWEESLDVDDSDLRPPPTVLRRCTTAFQSQTLQHSSPSQTVISLPQTLTEPQPPPPPPQVRTIPGPAGIVQAAKLKKINDSVNLLTQEEDLMTTQEYIRKVVEDPMEDDDFKRDPWLSAVEFVRDDGMFSSGCSNLGEINKHQRNGKLDQVVAVIKSCTPNGLGDMTVALKDPTGTASGTIHHKVLTEGDFRKGICVGSVLILQKVSVFSPSRSTHYLNITKRNLVKVFYKDGGSSQKQTFHVTIDAGPHYEDSVQGTPALASVFNIERGAEGITNRMKRSKTNSEQENMNCTSASNTCTHLPSEDSLQGTPALGSAFNLERGAEGITNRMKRSKTNNEQENMNCTSTTNKGTSLEVAIDKETLKEANITENGPLSDGSATGFEQVKALLPDWTEEQLLELAVWEDN